MTDVSPTSAKLHGDLTLHGVTKTVTFSDFSAGENCFILEKNNIQPMVKIGNNVILWSANHIGHRTVIRDHAYLASNICISGFCDIGERSWIGVGANFRDYCKVGADCFITMGAQVTAREVPAGSVVTGTPATVLGVDAQAARKLRQTYFGL